MENAVPSKQAIVWAVDPFEAETNPDSSLVKNMMNWARSSNLEIQPVYILTSARSEKELFIQSGGLRYYIGMILKGLGLSEARPVQVISSRGSIRQEDVEDLCKYAEEQCSPCIVVSSHGRSGLKKLVLGSFAENLLRHAKCPVLFLTHFKSSPEDERMAHRVLFPIDFSTSSHEAFHRFLPEAKRCGFELVLFHAVSLPAGALSGAYGNSFVIPDDYFKEQLSWAAAEGARWVKIAQSSGVTARFILKDGGIGSDIGKTILNIADQEKVGLISLSSSSGPVTSLVLGNIGRDIFRSNSYPVWVYGPKSLHKISSPIQEDLSHGETNVHSA